MENKQINPSDAELEILQILWELKEAPVKEIHEILQQRKSVGYTTVLKTMQIMFDKKILQRRPEGKGHIYKARVEQRKIQNNFLDKLLDKVYKGSTAEMVMSALGNHKTSKKELDQIKEFIRQQENKEE